MNILIPHSWLKDYLETEATPQKIAECLSLCGPSVEKVTKVGIDYVYDIEITTNRIDMASVVGIAREAAAILPRFGIKAHLKKDPYQYSYQKQKRQQKKQFNLKVFIKNKQLVPRFTAIVLNNVTIKPSPKLVQERLTKAGMRPINNIVDITNYLMRELGQPYHAFDFSQIKKQTMILRLSRRGEKITTLDGQTHILSGNDIIIEDGSGRIIDLCGIMGGSNSHVSNKTKKILLFVQNYDPMHIRQTCMNIGKRSEAAALFEKSPDPEMVLPALHKGVDMIKKNTQAKVASPLIDIYPTPYQPKKVKVSMQKVIEQLGTKISEKQVIKILNSLGFSLSNKDTSIVAKVPSWRAQDVFIAEDLIEEIARIYGYHNLPARLVTGDFPKPFKDPFYWEDNTKDILKNWGFAELYNYSFVSSGLLEKTAFNPQNCLRVSNPLSSEWQYLRPSLIPGILQTIIDNQSREEAIKIFELAKVYRSLRLDLIRGPTSKNPKLPDEKMMLVGAIVGEKFYEVKGVIETLLAELGIKNIKFEPKINETIVHQKLKLNIWHPGKSAIIKTQRKTEKPNLVRGSTIKTIGTVGEIDPRILKKFEIEGRVTFFELDFDQVLKLATRKKTYQPIAKYPPNIEDLAFVVPEKTLVGKMISEIKKISKTVSKIKLLDTYQNTRTFRIFFQHPKKSLTSQEVKKIKEEVIKRVGKKFGAKIKGSL